MPWVSLKELAEHTGFASRSLMYIRAQEPGVLITRQRGGRVEYKQPDCATALFRREREIAKRESKPASLDDAKARKLEAEAREAELRVSRLLGEVIPTPMHEEAVGEIVDRLRAVLINLAGNYGVQLEACGVPPEQAEAVLESIALELTRALQGVADDLDPGGEIGTQEEVEADGSEPETVALAE